MNDKIESPSVQHEIVAPLMVEAKPPLTPVRILSKTEVKFVYECVDVMVQLFRLYGFDDLGYAVTPTRTHWLLLASYCDPLKLMKFKLAAFYSAWKNQPLPDAPFPIELDNPRVLLGGRAYRFVHCLSSDSTFDSFLVSILYSKKGMPRPDKMALEKAEIAAFKKLTTLPTFTNEWLLRWGDVPEELPESVSLTLNRASAESQLRRTVREALSGSAYTDEDRFTPFFPSTSSNYINTRALGGAVGCILDDPALLQGLKSQENLIDLTVAGTGRMTRLEANTDELERRFRILYERILKEAVDESPLAVPLALPEALKTRVISKGPPLTYTAMKPLQKKLWSTLKKLPCFKLIGEPVTDWFVQERMGKNLRWDQGFLSVDYSDATNEMYSWVSDIMAEEISTMWGLTENESVLFKRSLTGHLIVNPDNDGDGRFSEPQANGQLMGSVTSFPLLCLANASICRWALELDYSRSFTLRDCPLAVNGDDGLLKCTSAGKLFWEKISSFHGLKPSIGKVYFSRSFLNINSTTYNYHYDGFRKENFVRKDGSEVERECKFELVKYINLGLLFGLKRSGGKAKIASVKKYDVSLGSQSRELMRLCPDSLQERVMGSFIHRHAEALRSARVPWFLPESIGGLGLATVGRYCPSDRERRLARVILDTGVKPPTAPSDAPWRVWEYVAKRFSGRENVVTNYSLNMLYEYGATVSSKSDLNVEVRNSDGDCSRVSRAGPVETDLETISFQSLFGYACIEALFRVNGIADLYSERDEDNGYLRKLQKFWKPIYRTPVYPEPMDLSKLPPTLSFQKENLITLYKNTLLQNLTTRLGNGDISGALNIVKVSTTLKVKPLIELLRSTIGGVCRVLDL